ncbi:MAG: hypothetical protein GF403_05415 [Candidatus Coatesbacteria bacterium]|nr:hypothetical protein [Candidatus Coatesbacteria bacterium]
MRIVLPALLALTLIAGSVQAEPVEARDVDPPTTRVGIHIGLGLGYRNVFSDTLPQGADQSCWLGRFEIGLSYAKIIGVKFQLGIGTFDWTIEEDRAVPMGHYLQSVDLYTLIPLGERWRLRPAAGYTFSSNLVDSQGTGFGDAQGFHLQLAGEFQLKEVLWLSAGVGYHLTGEYADIDIDEPEVIIPDSVDAQHLDMFFQVVFSLE